MEDINFDINDNRSVPIWTKPEEFAAGKNIQIVKFNRLNGEKGETTAKFLDKEGYTYRLTYIDLDKGNKERYLEVHSHNFKDDLAMSVKKEFGTNSLPVGSKCFLKVEKVTREYKMGAKIVNKWTLSKLIQAPSLNENSGAESSEEINEGDAYNW